MKNLLRLSVLPLAMASFAAECADAQRQSRWVNASDVLLRVGPGSNHQALGSFERGAELTLTDGNEENGYCNVVGEGLAGFVACRYLTTEKVERLGESSSLPAFTYADPPTKWTFLQPTTTHPGESPLKPGQGWLALVPNSSGWELVETVLKAERVAGAITSYDVAISSTHKNAIAFVRIPGAKPGLVATPANSVQGYMPNFQSKVNGKYPQEEISFAGETYRVYAKEFSTPLDDGNGKIVVSKYGEYFIRSGNRETSLGMVGDGSSDDYSMITWMGDLDGDGKLDVITAVYGSNSSGVCLHLSGTAKGKALFGPAICHIGTGC